MVGMNAAESYKLEKLQNRIYRIIYYPATPPSDKTSIQSRRNSQALKIYKQAHLSKSNPLNCLIPPRLPHSKHFRQPHAISTRRLHAFIPWTTLIVNNKYN